MFEEDLLAVNRAGLTNQQAGRDNTSARPVFSDPEIKCCEEASPGQKQDCLGWRRRLLIFERRKNFAARQNFTIGAQRGVSTSKVLGDRYSRSQGDYPRQFLGDEYITDKIKMVSPKLLGDRYGSDSSEIPNSKFLGDRHDRSRNETFPAFLGDRAGSTKNILDFKYQVGQQSVPEAVVCKTSPGFSGNGFDDAQKIFSFKSAEFAPEQVLPVYKPTPAQRLSVIRKRNNVSNSRNRCRMVQEDEEVEHSPSFDNHGESLHCQPSVNTKHHRLVRHHELLKPDKFDGTGCLKTFLKKFEICAMYNQWSMDDMEAYLSCSLTGEAAEVLWDLAGLGYQELVTKLENRYGTSDHEESLPGRTVKVGGTFNKRFFLFALNDADLELKVRNMQDTTENRMKAVEWQLNALRQSVDVIQDNKVQSAVPRSRSEKVCFGCGKPGHFISQCPQKNIPNKKRLGLLDSGSRVSIIPSSMVDVARVTPTKRSLKAANNTEIPIKGEMRLWIKVGGFSKLASVLVSDHVSEIILGLDWLVNNKVSWKFDEAQITVGNKNRVVKLVTKRLSERQLCRIYSSVEVQILARAEIDVPTKLVGTRLADLSWVIVENKLDQQLLQENLVNVKTIIDELTRDAPEEGRRELSELLNNFQDVFSDTGTEIGVAKGIYHKINTEQARPIKQQLRRHPPAHQKVIAKQVDEMLEQDVIEPSRGPWLKTGALYWKSLYDAKVKVLTLRPGDKVWDLYPRSWQEKSPKWVSPYVGPYIVDHLIPPVNAAIKKTTELNRRMKQCSKCGRRMLTRNHKRHFDRCSGAGNSASDSQLVSLGRAIPYLENSTPEKAVNAWKLSFPGIPSSELWKNYVVARASMSELVAALTPSFSLENCAEEPTQRKRRASEARRWVNQFIAFELPNEAHQETSLGSVPMSSHVEIAGESLVDTPCSTARPSLWTGYWKARFTRARRHSL
ncbi:hypothetical protein HELRODRAFT_180351 [Helobdella robusta]|uniref:CCHC-type domain-containing protein n=1 Tax=Helobdella robusta TaxID=6412 RepID=T1FFT0_HELRO|nr:hypothetical protein HELRODRAFT_180351 [Helobdella robusta]ESN93942.1 hypothetical protein HELRODRAFT_180351 [Helobdella robusta]